MNRYSSLSDEELMVHIVVRNPSAFEEIYERYAKRLLFFICRMLNGNEAKAQDILQDVFLKVAEKPERFDPARRFSTWIFNVAFNAVKNEHRYQGSKTFLSIDNDMESLHGLLADVSAETERAIDIKRFKECLIKELAGLTKHERITFWLRFQEHFSIRELSAILKCPEGTVSSRLHNTTRKLAAKLSRFKMLIKEE